jgi:hypothetical protein
MDRHSLANLWFRTILGVAHEPHICSAICFSVIDYGPRGPGIYLDDCTNSLLILVRGSEAPGYLSPDSLPRSNLHARVFKGHIESVSFGRRLQPRELS